MTQKRAFGKCFQTRSATLSLTGPHGVIVVCFSFLGGPNACRVGGQRLAGATFEFISQLNTDSQSVSLGRASSVPRASVSPPLNGCDHRSSIEQLGA
jgi:hypothetical protein